MVKKGPHRCSHVYSTKPLNLVRMKILGPLPKRRHRNHFMVLRRDWYGRLTKAIPVNSTTETVVALIFLENWSLSYWIPPKNVAGNLQKFTTQLFATVCKTLSANNIYTTEYHQPRNGQAELFSSTIAFGLRHFVLGHRNTWGTLKSPLAYFYNVPDYISTKFLSFS